MIERLSDAQNIARILVSKLGPSVNAWVVESSTFNGPFAVYKEFIPSVNSRGEPKCYDPSGFPASTFTALLLSKCFEEAKKLITGRQHEASPSTMHFTASTSSSCQPKTIILGFSKGGTVLNQLLSELAHSTLQPTGTLLHFRKQVVRDSPKIQEGNEIFPMSKDSLLNSISDFHYVDVGLNSVGAYLTEQNVIKKIAEWSSHGTAGIHFTLHGTPRQWCDSNRPWIRNEKDRLLQLLQDEASRSGGKLLVCERFYFANCPPNLQMHFEIIENLDMS
ncbi:uncharacterized protein LOC143877258 isoform X2 [Tasmannia lanceolata]